MPPVDARAFSITNMIANPVLIPLLRSPLGGRLGRRLALVQYVGRRSGRTHRLVAEYSLDGPRVHIRVGDAARKTWWRNFRTPAPVQLRLAGVEHDANAVVVRKDQDVLIEAVLEDLGV
jgi:hypothetical protein